MAKRTFKKGYLPNWTEELFTVVKCIETIYLVKDEHGEILEGTFYAEELQKVSHLFTPQWSHLLLTPQWSHPLLTPQWSHPL